ncbi:IclR family transcriptional regulator [Streptomyces sp. TG1A-8]|uniref:IclR family transcriptional regulator n=1 Tax=Streptomyces sp. TG1A-8 TaxID=3051385 RepID=UPI00265C8920|nr:IclR family transcriptional regulator [Streptomyces sp. TG1A-8]MDO0930035.1 IclR family transcriptional regulator [Streptomyces sp. TG1A-8]
MAETQGGNTARRALRLLEAVAASRGPVSLQEVAETVGLNKPTAYRLLRVLQEEAYLVHVDSGGYRIGTQLMALAAQVMPRADAFVEARPVLQALARQSGETATLHLRAGDEAVLVLGVESAHELRRAARLGSTTPLHRGCSGQAILAYLPAREVTALLKRAPEHPDPSDVEHALSTVREQGFAVSEGANHPGLTGLAASVLTPAGHPAASVAISGPSGRWTAAKAREFASVLNEHCARLTSLLAPSPTDG